MKKVVYVVISALLCSILVGCGPQTKTTVCKISEGGASSTLTLTHKDDVVLKEVTEQVFDATVIEEFGGVEVMEEYLAYYETIFASINGIAVEHSATEESASLKITLNYEELSQEEFELSDEAFAESRNYTKVIESLTEGGYSCGN